MVRQAGIAALDEYRDTGCDIHPACLECPLPLCRFDVHVNTQARMARAAEAARLLDQGMGVPAVAARLGLSVRETYRLIQHGGRMRGRSHC